MLQGSWVDESLCVDLDVIYEEEVVSVGLVYKIKSEEGKSQNQRCDA